MKDRLNVPVPELFATPVDLADAFRSHIAKFRRGNTRRAHIAAAYDLSAWCKTNAIRSIDKFSDLHAGQYLADARTRLAHSTVRQRVSCIRGLLVACRGSTAELPTLKAISFTRSAKWHAEATIPDHVVMAMIDECAGTSDLSRFLVANQAVSRGAILSASCLA